MYKTIYQPQVLKPNMLFYQINQSKNTLVKEFDTHKTCNNHIIPHPPKKRNKNKVLQTSKI